MRTVLHHRLTASELDDQSAEVTDGTDTANATDGTDTASATDGTDTANATDGTDTASATDGTSTADGTDGTSTADGTDGTDTGQARLARWVETTRGRWGGGTSVALATVGVGVVAGRAALLLVAAVPLALAATAASSRPPRLGAESVTAQRTVSETEPTAGDHVTVTVAVRNETGRTLADVRLRDHVPPGLTVVDGTPERVTALRSGATARLSYTVEASRGRHEFDRVDVTVAGAVGGAARAGRLSTEPVVVRCVPPLPAVDRSPERAAAALAGPTVSHHEGAGVEFSSVREYRRGDPTSRIDWNGWARRGEPTTVSFRAERMARVVVVVDSRRPGYTLDRSGTPAVERSVTAAATLIAGLCASGHRVGLAALGAADCALEPSAGRRHRRRLERTLALDPAFGYERRRAEHSTELSALRRRLPSDARVVLCTPLADDGAVTAALRLRAAGHRVAVVSPDPTATCGDGESDQTARFAGVERTTRLSTLRERGVSVVDGTSEHPTVALQRRWPL
jgi:uncharacterized repeat protein (TIGR01451 family)